MPSLHGPESEASTNGVNAQHLDDEVEEPTTGGVPLDDEWTEDELEEARRIGYDRGASYAVLPGWLANDPRLTPPMLCALVHMSMHAAGDRLNLSQPQLATKLRVSQQAVSKTMKRLAELGHIQKLTEGGRPAWRLRWLTNRPQPTVVRVASTAQPTVVDAQPTVVAHAHAELPVLSTSSSSSKDSSRSRKPKAPPIPLSDEERARLHKKYGGFYPSTEALDDVIDIALNHVAVEKAKGEYRYVMGWIQRDIRDRKLFDTNLAVAKARLARAKGEPTHNPLVSEPAPFLTRSAWDIPESRDRTHD